jgi:hypothetical protein
MIATVNRGRYPQRLSITIISPVLLALSTVFITAGSAAATDDSLASLLARARVAINYGHASAHSLHAGGTINIGGFAGTYEEWIDMTNGRFTEVIDAGPFSGASGYDGNVAWQEDAKGIVFPQNAPGAIAFAANRRFQTTNSLFAPNYGGAAVSYLGNRSADGVSYEAISVIPPGGYATEWWFDSATALPGRRILIMMGRTTTTVLGDYRNLGGWIIPYSRTDTTDNDYTITTKLTSVETDPSDLEQHLLMPQSHSNDYSLSGSEVRVPMQVFKDHIYVDVLINGKGPFHFLFDTGAYNLMDPTVAYQVGGQAIASLHGMSGLGRGVIETQYVKVQTVSLRGATLSDQYFNVAQLGPRTNYIPFYEKPFQEMQGLIGYEFLARYQVTIDYAHSQLILRLPQSSLNLVSDAHVPLMFDEKHVFVGCSLAGVSSSCLADTGNSFGVMLYKPFIDAHPQVLPRWYTGAGYIGGINGRSRVNFGKLSSLEIGSDSVPDVDAVFSLEDKGGLSDPFYGALIGNPFLKHFTVTFDYPNAMLYLALNASFAAK